MATHDAVATAASAHQGLTQAAATASARMTTAAGSASVGRPSHSGCNAVAGEDVLTEQSRYAVVHTNVEKERCGGIDGAIAMWAPHACAHLYNACTLWAWFYTYSKGPYATTRAVRTASGGMVRCSVSRSRRLRCKGRTTVRCTTAGTWCGVASAAACAANSFTDRCRV